MHRVVVLYPHPEDPKAFEEHYRNVHLPLAKKLPGMLDHRFSLNIDAGEQESPYFAIFEADFQSKEAYEFAMASPEGQAVGADVPNYATGGAIVMHFAAESI
ncbi:EthD family reductase [Nesterenkonia haasae]|uniref:EthD family reductase n=1 Tax=Nesterenkonia haasae TaxID=2587813 RepID=UPI0013920D28|nr:EthD family reductase [Nesterenkonia haasae]NDK31934.1 EthD family reductase [Nesterenkonia haasae]